VLNFLCGRFAIVFLAGKYMSLKSFSIVGLLSTVLLNPVLAQTKIFKETDVTEKAILDALRPGPLQLRATPNKEESLASVLGDLSLSSKSISIVAAPPVDNKPRPISTGSAPVLLTFDANSTYLTPQAKRTLDIIVRSLSNAELAGLNFSIVGHADLRGSSAKNLVLSQSRAESVKSYLVSEHKFPSNRLIPLGKGDLEPLSRTNPAAPENRRVDFVTRK
jgi:OmpA-OmpF porin, OOP family